MTKIPRTIRNVNEKPLITVAMPIYNAAKHLRFSVLSILNQTYKNWELLIIDDGSIDGGLDSISDIKDARIILIKETSNSGIANRLNQAIDLAKGKYFARMDHDDIAFPSRLEKQLNILLGDSSIDLIAAQAITIDDENRVIGNLQGPKVHNEICAMPWRSFHMPHPTWMGKTEWFKKYHYSYDKPYCSEDQELLLRSFNESKFSSCDETLLAYRVRLSNNFFKLIRTRFGMLRFQSVYFLRASQFGYFILAILSFGLRFFLDAFYMLRKIPFYPYKFTPITEAVRVEFQELNADINKQSIRNYNVRK